MESMVERVARAMCQHDCAEILTRDKVKIPDWDSDPDLERRKAYLRSARVAIEAMREPTDAMCEAADWYQQSDVNQYQSAIDAALSTPDS